MLKVHPTFVDVEPAYLIDCQRLIPNFFWECSITQAEFDLLDDDSKCSLCYSYQDFIYNNPANIKALRAMAPTITITRNAPTAVPVFSGCVAEAREAACLDKKDYKGDPCVYQGGCKGACNCAYDPVLVPQDLSGMIDVKTLLIYGGIAVGAYGVYYVFFSGGGGD